MSDEANKPTLVTTTAALTVSGYDYNDVVTLAAYKCPTCPAIHLEIAVANNVNIQIKLDEKGARLIGEDLITPKHVQPGEDLGAKAPTHPPVPGQ